MKIGLYDSGLGGLSVLNRFLAQYPDFEYIYYGDSARAPYGEKSKEELKSFVTEIFDFMEDKKVDIVISACNTSSMLLHEMDLGDYSFKVLSLFDVMKDHFEIEEALNANCCDKRKASSASYGFLATPANIDIKRYKDWATTVFPVKCPRLVPLVESGKIEKAREEFSNYLSELPEEINKVIVGCTHYSFLVNNKTNNHFLNYDFLDPADVLIRSKKLREIIDSVLDKSIEYVSSPAQIHCTGNLIKFSQIANDLLISKNVEFIEAKAKVLI